MPWYLNLQYEEKLWQIDVDLQTMYMFNRHQDDLIYIMCTNQDSIPMSRVDHLEFPNLSTAVSLKSEFYNH